MDPFDSEELENPSTEPVSVTKKRPEPSPGLDRWLTIALWSAVLAVIGFGAFFAWSVYAQQQADRLSNPAYQVIDALQKQLDAQPDSAELHSRMAEALHDAGDIARAKQELLTAIQLDEKYIGAYQNLAHIELDEKDYEASKANWQKVLDLTADSQMQDVNKRRELAYFNLGDIAMIQEDWVSAVGYFNAAIRITKDAGSYLLLAKAYLELGQNDMAMDKVNATLAFIPNYAEAHFVRGKLYLAAGDIVDAAWDFRAAADGAAEMPAALAEAQAALASLGTYDSWYGKAADASASKDTSAALAAVQVARSIQPESYDAAMLHGQILEGMGDAKGAVDAYTVALKVRPDDPAATAALKRAQAAIKE
jgi:tetratricopeptide (TPR) repeat protein